MTYRVILSPFARQELYEDFIWWETHRDAVQAERWIVGFERALATLSINPERHPCAVEADRHALDLRQMLYGLGKRPTHRAVFEIRGEEVFVHAIRHLARNDLSTDDLAN